MTSPEVSKAMIDRLLHQRRDAVAPGDRPQGQPALTRRVVLRVISSWRGVLSGETAPVGVVVLQGLL